MRGYPIWHGPVIFLEEFAEFWSVEAVVVTDNDGDITMSRSILRRKVVKGPERNEEQNDQPVEEHRIPIRAAAVFTGTGDATCGNSVSGNSMRSGVSINGDRLNDSELSRS